jgi:diguanylate cyclase (GGDEF)-like protein
MDSSDEWIHHLKTLCEQYANRLLTQRQFDDVLRTMVIHPGSLLAATIILFQPDEPFEEIIVGISGSGDPTNVFPIELKDPRKTKCRVSLWYKDFDNHETILKQVRDYLVELARCFWKPDLRDDKSTLPNLDKTAAYGILDASLPSFLEESRILGIFYCDLDHFGEVNGTFGHSTGDRVILEFASILDRTVRPVGVAIHRGGDEFAIVYPAEQVDELLFLAYRLRQEMSSHDFDIQPLKLDMASGITWLNRTDDIVPYKELEKRAEITVSPGGNVKYRGQTRIETREEAEIAPDLGEYARDLALCILKSGIASPRPFASPWLNMFSQYTSSILQNTPLIADTSTNITDQLNAVLRWVDPILDNHKMFAALAAETGLDTRAQFSLLDYALAVAHGVLRATLEAATDWGHSRLEVEYGTEGSAFCRLMISPNEIQLLEYAEEEAEATDDVVVTANAKDSTALVSNILKLGSFYTRTFEGPIDERATRRALLVKIGAHPKLSIPTALFAGIIVVDDRPTSGGGLPDFWEAAIARLIALTDVNPNIEVIYVIGNVMNAAHTVKRLKSLDTWMSNAEQLSDKTGMSTKSILTAATRLEGKVKLVDTEEELIRHLADTLRDSLTVAPVTPPGENIKQGPFLQRRLELEDMALRREDGCRAHTVAEAYPLVLEIARQTSVEGPVLDEAENRLKELIDFKVHLSNPTQDLVPTFYAGEKDSLHEYFVTQFTNTDGLFGKVFVTTGQLEAVVQHLSDVISGAPQPYATRRAILVVPHEIREGNDIAPLGLVSVRIAPRFVGNKTILHFSYTWRTVEAVKGFPYSLYGSVRYSQYLAQLIQERLPPRRAKGVSIGEISYIAHSLHIYLDDYGNNIARKIVNDASL